jgi:hypothetical protein
VLSGAAETLRIHQPTMVLELSPNVLEENGHSIEELDDLLASAGYRLWGLGRGRSGPMSAVELGSRIPRGGSINVVARPRGT